MVYILKEFPFKIYTWWNDSNNDSIRKITRYTIRISEQFTMVPIVKRNTGRFFQSDWLDMNEERGRIRRQRVYRKLLLSLGVYREKDMDEDFAYIKNYRSAIENDMESKK
ncbi:MAG: TIGR02678 family protein [Lachnospiraceae bacterium]|nr:TIGR02678 family protein [Lachnospiraceae bacterium]